MKYLALILLLSGCCSSVPKLKPDTTIKYDGGKTYYAVEEVYLKLTCPTDLGN